MGQFNSKSFQTEIKHELSFIETIINNIMKNENITNYSEYLEKKDTVCSKYTYFLEKNLHKHKKQFIEELNDNLYIIPKNNTQNNVSKETICTAIINHYKRAIKYIFSIKSIIDIENSTENSIGKICINNIVHESTDVISVNVCKSKQYFNNSESRKLDLNELAGFSILTNDLLSPEESKLFKKLISSLLRKKRLSLLNSDKMVLNKFKNLSKDILSFDKSLKGGRFFKVSENNLIFSNSTCYLQKKIILKKSKSIQIKLDKQYEDFLKTVQDFKSILFELVDFENNVYKLKILSHDELNVIENRLKKTSMSFYLQSIVNYNLILDDAIKNVNNKSR